MPWGFASSKRSRDAEICEECEETFDPEEDEGWGVCGGCERTMCEDCMQSQCDVCKEKYDREDYDSLLAESSACCEGCMASCKDCEDFCCHNCCLAEHLKNCSKKSRAQRALSAAEQTISTTESELQNAKSQLAIIQSRIESLERQLTTAKQSKVAADEELKTEVDNASTKDEAKEE